MSRIEDDMKSLEIPSSIYISCSDDCPGGHAQGSRCLETAESLLWNLILLFVGAPLELELMAQRLSSKIEGNPFTR